MPAEEWSRAKVAHGAEGLRAVVVKLERRKRAARAAAKMEEREARTVPPLQMQGRLKRQTRGHPTACIWNR